MIETLPRQRSEDPVSYGEMLQKKDIHLIGELHARMGKWKPTFVPEIGLHFRNRELADMVKPSYSSEELIALEEHLVKKGTLAIEVKCEAVILDGKSVQLATIAATDAKGQGDMSRQLWIRDLTLTGEAMMYMWHSDKERYKEEGKNAKDILMSSLHVMSTSSQLDRFQALIESNDDTEKDDQNAWPQIALDFDKLDSKEPTPWRHIQDAFQMLTHATFDAFDKDLLQPEDLDANHKQFLGFVTPFLASVGFTNRKNSGSWEELPAVRTSVLAVETAALVKIKQYANKEDFKFLEAAFEKNKKYLPQYEDVSFTQALDHMINQGLAKIAEHLPFEAPADPGSPEYRTADAALLYVSKYGIPELLDGKTYNGKSFTKEDVEETLFEQIESLTDPFTHGMRRYGTPGMDLMDTYQGLNFHTNGKQKAVSEMKQQKPDPLTKFMEYQDIVDPDAPAAWTLFTPQAATEKITAGDMPAAIAYFNRTLAQITGEDESHVVKGMEGAQVAAVPANKLTECFVTFSNPYGDPLVVASPHVPLNWSVAETKKVLALLIAATKEKNFKRRKTHQMSSFKQ